MYVFSWLVAILIEFIILAITGEIAMMGVIIITFGIMFLTCLLKGQAADRRALIVAMVYTFLWGGALCLDPLVRGTYDWGVRFTTFAFAGGMGGCFISLGLYSGLIKVLTCTERVEAVYIGASVYKVKTSESYSPMFEYKRNNQVFRNSTGESFSKRKLEKTFQVGNTYQIYLNPKNPLSMCVNRRISGASILVMWLGIMFVLVGIYGDF